MFAKCIFVHLNVSKSFNRCSQTPAYWMGSKITPHWGITVSVTIGYCKYHMYITVYVNTWVHLQHFILTVSYLHTTSSVLLRWAMIEKQWWNKAIMITNVVCPWARDHRHDIISQIWAWQGSNCVSVPNILRARKIFCEADIEKPPLPYQGCIMILRHSGEKSCVMLRWPR